MDTKIRIEKDKGFSLFLDKDILIHSDILIKPVHENSLIFMVWKNQKEFMLYSVRKKKYIFYTRLFYNIKGFSQNNKSFVAYYDSEKLGKRCNLVFDDGNICDSSAICISDEQKSIRIFQLAENKWIYFNEANRKFLWPVKKAYYRELGHPFMNFGTFIEPHSKKLYLWHFDKRKILKKSSIKYFYNFKDTLSDKFTEIPNTSFFLGINYINRNTTNEKPHIRIYHVTSESQIDKSDEVYSECLYISKINSFLVNTEIGWTIIKYNSKGKCFIKTRCNFYYNRPEINIIDDFIFIKKGFNEWDFFCKDEEYNSYIWKNIQLLEDIQYVVITNFFNERKKIPISEIKKEYLILKQRMIDETKSMIGETEPMTDETKPMTDETKPMTDETKPMTDETRPMTDETKPMTDEAKPMTDEAKPILSEINIDYYYFGYANEYLNKTLKFNIPLTQIQLKRGDGIAWIQNNSPFLYLVKYESSYTCKIIDRIALNSEDYELFKNFHLTSFQKFPKVCSSSNILAVLREIYTEKKKEQYSNLKCNKFNIVIKNTYNYLLENSNKEKVIKAIYLLFEDRIHELYNISTKIDNLLSEIFPSNNIKDIINEQFVKEITEEIESSTNNNKFSLSYNYHSYFGKLSIYDALIIACKENQVSDILQKKIDKKLKEIEDIQKKTTDEKVKKLFEIIIEDKIDYVPTETTEKGFGYFNNRVSNNSLKIRIRNTITDLVIGQTYSLKDLNANSREFQRKEEYIMIFLPKDKIKSDNGIYKIIGEGKNLNENQVIGRNANYDIAKNLKRILIFSKNNDNSTCTLFDEVKCIDYKSEKDPTPNANRTIIVFSLKSLHRFL